MGPLDAHILEDTALSRTKTGFTLAFRSHWYRSLPMSCMDVALSIDGVEIPRDRLAVEANGRRFPAEKLIEQTDHCLFIQDAALLHVDATTPAEKGARVEVAFRLDLYIPYILIGPDAQPLLASTTIRKTMICP
jgi:hypothetical protein